MYIIYDATEYYPSAEYFNTLKEAKEYIKNNYSLFDEGYTLAKVIESTDKSSYNKD